MNEAKICRSINPATSKPIAEYPLATSREILDLVGIGDRRYQTWRSVSLQERQDHLVAFACELQASAEDLAEMITLEMGKPKNQSLAEVAKSVKLCHHFAEHAEAYLRPETLSLGEHHAQVHLKPRGIVLGIMPWNFPIWQSIRFLIPTVLTGNTALLKLADNVQGCSQKLAKVAARAGWPEGVFQTIAANHRQIAELIAEPRIAGVSLTGSTEGGRAVGEAAGRAIKPCVLELGGSDPYLVLDDADVEKAAKICLKARMINTGQSCIAAKRMIVTEKSYGTFIETIIKECRLLQVGNPTHPNADLGPLAREDLLHTMDQQLRQALSSGGQCLYGEEHPIPEGGFFARPYVITQAGHVAKVGDPEIFGPICMVYRVQDEREAFAVANRSHFALGAAIFCRDTERAHRLAIEDLDAGMVAINRALESDPRVPFGGIKTSGIGRECGREGIRAFANIKSIIS